MPPTSSSDEMVDKFLRTSAKVGKNIKALILTTLGGYAFYFLFFIKALSTKILSHLPILPVLMITSLKFRYLVKFKKL